MINVTKPYLPPFEKFSHRLQKIWERNYLTNQGPELLSLEERLKEYLGVRNVMVVNNGTIALQLAIKALNITGDVITTPFSYVATTNSIIWEGCNPVFVDIDPATCCIDADLIEKAITPETSAIMAVHVYGIGAEVDKIQQIANKHGLKVIYDAAHAFGVKNHGQSILNFGDISTLSFHATKLFHTIEGGAIICNDDQLFDTIRKLGTFGHIGDDYFLPGVNAKLNEVSAAMGHCVLDDIDIILQRRKQVSEIYSDELKDTSVCLPTRLLPAHLTANYSYFPVIFDDELSLLKCMARLNTLSIYPRRYFYPPLNTLPYLNKAFACPIAEDISSRVICLPLYPDLEDGHARSIASTVKRSFA